MHPFRAHWQIGDGTIVSPVDDNSIAKSLQLFVHAFLEGRILLVLGVRLRQDAAESAF